MCRSLGILEVHTWRRRGSGKQFKKLKFYEIQTEQVKVPVQTAILGVVGGNFADDPQHGFGPDVCWPLVGLRRVPRHRALLV